jgi:AraC-like DNA-binding protein
MRSTQSFDLSFIRRLCKTAIELIHIFLISEAKNILKRSDKNVTEIANALGFENSPYFSRLFKREVGMSPQQYKKHFLN